MAQREDKLILRREGYEVVVAELDENGKLTLGNELTGLSFASTSESAGTQTYFLEQTVTLDASRDWDLANILKVDLSSFSQARLQFWCWSDAPGIGSFEVARVLPPLTYPITTSTISLLTSGDLKGTTSASNTFEYCDTDWQDLSAAVKAAGEIYMAGYHIVDSGTKHFTNIVLSFR